MEITPFRLFNNVMKYFSCQFKICEGMKFANIMLRDMQANKFGEQDFILLKLALVH